MEKNRIIFDLDGTLLFCDFLKVEEDFFTTLFKQDGEVLFKNIGLYLDEYEKTNPFYDKEKLARFLSMKSGLNITSEVINEWNRLILETPDIIEDGVVDLLEYLKSHDKSLVVLTNWFRETQVPRLKKAGLIDYFDYVISGDISLKPHKEAYLKAMGEYSFDKCIMIGDGIDKDYYAPKSIGIDSILYDNSDKEDNKKLIKVKKVNEIINIIK